MSERLTDEELADVAETSRGFDGRFFYDGECDDLVYIARACDEKQCDCNVHLNSDGDQDCSVSVGTLDGIDDVAEPIAQMLNAVPRMLAELRALRLSPVDREHLLLISVLVRDVLLSRQPDASATDSQRVAWSAVNAALAVLTRILEGK